MKLLCRVLKLLMKHLNVIDPQDWRGWSRTFDRRGTGTDLVSPAGQKYEWLPSLPGQHITLINHLHASFSAAPPGLDRSPEQRDSKSFELRVAGQNLREIKACDVAAGEYKSGRETGSNKTSKKKNSLRFLLV